jgi:hypothetical protein
MKYMNAVRKFGPTVRTAARKYGPGVAGFTLLPLQTAVMAQSSDIAEAATGALANTQTDVTSVAVVVAAVVALIAAAALIFGMLKKG